MSEATELARLLLQPSQSEARLAEAYDRVVDRMSRVHGAVEGGSWYFLRDKAAELQEAAQRLRRVLCDRDGEYLPPSTTAPDTVARLSAVYAQGYTAGRLLYPVGEITNTRLRDLCESEERRRQAWVSGGPVTW